MTTRIDRLVPRAVTLGLVATLMLAGPLGEAAVAAAGDPPSDPHALLFELASRFTWAPIETQATVVQVQVTGETGGIWHLVPLDGGDVELRPGPAPDPGFGCELDLETLGRLYRGEMTGITAAGKDDAATESPLEILPGSAVPEDAPRATLAPVFHFLTHFFDRARPERIRLERDAARTLHGAHMVGLYYHPGFRSAWYSIRGDEVLGGDGDTTGYPQAFVVMRGRARLRYGYQWLDVEEGETVYIPPGVLHAVGSRDGGEVELLWLAWGDGA